MEQILPIITDGFWLGVGVCFGTVCFEWTRRLIRAVGLAGIKFVSWVSTWGMSPEWMKQRRKR